MNCTIVEKELEEMGLNKNIFLRGIEMNTKLKEFYNYCASFYLDKDAPYRMKGLTKKELKRLSDFFAKSPNFYGDSFDRELVRNALDQLGFVPNSITEEL